jgi:hypothetical protein
MDRSSGGERRAGRLQGGASVVDLSDRHHCGIDSM